MQRQTDEGGERKALVADAGQGASEARKAGLLLGALAVTPDAALRLFREARKLPPHLPEARLREARELLVAVHAILAGDDDTRWSRLTEAAAVLANAAAPIAPRPASLPPPPPPLRSPDLRQHAQAEASPWLKGAAQRPASLPPPLDGSTPPPAPEHAHLRSARSYATLPFRRSASLEARPQISATPLPRALPFPAATPADGPDLSLDDYARLCAEWAVLPDTRSEILRRYRISEGAIAGVHRNWERRFADDATQWKKWSDLMQTYMSWLRDRR